MPVLVFLILALALLAFGFPGWAMLALTAPIWLPVAFFILILSLYFYLERNP